MRIRVWQTKFVSLLLLAGLCTVSVFSMNGCAQVNVPEARNVDIPSPKGPEKRRKAVNEHPDSVMYLPLGEDVLVPEVLSDNPLPDDRVGPFELRNETLAGALQLILADYDISLAFETDEAFKRHITVANLHGTLDKVIRRVCSLADMYCSYEDNGLTVKDKQTFTVTLPPIGSTEDSDTYMDDIATGLAAVLGEGTEPIVDKATRTLIYTATQRNAELASRYFQKLRASTAMIVFETYIWEVSLNAGNTMGIDWSLLDSAGKYNFSVGVDGAVGANFTSPISIGLPTTQAITNPTDVVDFLSKFGAVKSISQPQITVLSGSTAELRVAETENYVSEVTTTLVDGGSSSTSVSTDSVDSGFTLNIGSTWDKSTVYANISIALTDVLTIDNFVFSDGGDTGTSTAIQLPQTTERELTTQIRVRPGDSVLIGGLTQEQDNFNNEGPGFMEPIVPQSRTAEADNLELVFLLRPRVVAYTMEGDMKQKAMKASSAVAASNASSSSDALAPSQPKRLYSNRFEEGASANTAPVVPPQPVQPAAPVVSAAPVVAPTPEPEPIVQAPAPAPVPIATPAPAPMPEPIANPEPEPVVRSSAQPADVPVSAPVSSVAPRVSEAPSTYGSNFKSRYMTDQNAAPVRAAVSQVQPTVQNTNIAAPAPVSSYSPVESAAPDLSATSSYSSSYEPPSENNVEVYGVNGGSSETGTSSTYSTYGATGGSSGSVSPSTYY